MDIGLATQSRAVQKNDSLVSLIVFLQLFSPRLDAVVDIDIEDIAQCVPSFFPSLAGGTGTFAECTDYLYLQVFGVNL